MQESFSNFGLQNVIPGLFTLCDKSSEGLEKWRRDLLSLLDELEGEALDRLTVSDSGSQRRVGWCASILRTIFSKRSEEKAGFSVVQALFDVVHKIERQDLQPAFYAELISLFKGVCGSEPAPYAIVNDDHGENDLNGREAALLRSSQLDVRNWNRTRQDNGAFFGRRVIPGRNQHPGRQYYWNPGNLYFKHLQNQVCFRQDG